MNKLKITALFLALAVLAGCANGLPGLRPTTYAIPGETRVFFRSDGKACVHAPGGENAAPIISAFAVEAANKLLTNFGTVLTKAAEGGKLEPTTGSRNIQLPKGRVPTCVLIIRGDWEPDGEASTDRRLKAMAPLPPDLNEETLKARLDSMGVPKIYRVQHIIELVTQTSADGIALTMIPVFARIDQSTDGAKEGKRDVTIQVHMATVGASEPAGSVMTIQNRQIGETYIQDPKAPGTMQMAWFKSPFEAAPPGTKEKKADPASPQKTAAGKADLTTPPPDVKPAPPPSSTGAAVPVTPSATAAGDTGAALVPLTLTTNVVETRPTREGLAFLAAVYATLLPSIKTSAGNILNPDVAAVTKQTALASEQNKYAAASGSLAAALIAINDYCVLGADPKATVSAFASKSAVAQSSQYKANADALTSGQPIEFPKIMTVTTSPPDGWNKSICNAPQAG